MSRKFQQTTQQLLEIDPSAAHDLARFMAWRMIRSSFIVRISVLTLFLSAFLLLNIRSYHISDLLIVFSGGYIISINILVISKFCKRCNFSKATQNYG